MTFIAAVIARKGVAVIADSLATSMEKVVSYDHFMDYLKRKQESANGGKVQIDRNEIVRLFEKKPSHTSDYAEKLFQFDQFTAITLAGASRIGGKMIEYLIKESVIINAQDKYYQSKTIETRVSDFCAFMNERAREYALTKVSVGRSKLLFIHYEPVTEVTSIYRITIGRGLKSNNYQKDWDYVSCEKVNNRDIVFEGQDRISRGILEGEKIFLAKMIPKTVETILKDLDIPPDSLPIDYMEKLFFRISSNWEWDNMMNRKLSDLSLQQAVDLAYLFMKIEVSFQKYTQKIPSVGGVIRLAVIDRQGFRFITGHNIKNPY